MKAWSRTAVEWAFVLALVLIAAGCGKKNDASIDSIGGGYIATISAETTNLEIKGAADDQQYILLPFFLGNFDTVDGGTNEKFTLSFAKGTASLDGLSLSSQRPSLVEAPLTDEEWRDLRRTVWNRFDPSLGNNQPDWLWDAVRRLDRTSMNWNLNNDFVSDRTFESALRRTIAHYGATNHALRRAPAANLTEAGCPDVYYMPENSDPHAVPAGSGQTDYCLVLASSPTSATAAEIKTAMTRILADYKLIYNDTFPDVNGFSFKPIIVVVDFTDDTVWNYSALGAEVEGVFMKSTTDLSKRPVLYIGADIAAQIKNTTAAVAKTKFMSTLGHELQHAIMDYYRVRKNAGSPETIAVDEGFAHFMENVFGYAAPVYENRVRDYLTTLAEASVPAIYGAVLNSSASDAAARGAAFTLMYYLVSQKGGLKFSNGRVSGGDGLDFVRSVVQARTIGSKTLRQAFGGDWVATMGNYFAALVVDGMDYGGADESFKVQDPVTDVQDLVCGTGSFGLHFNKYSGLADRTANYKKIPSEDTFESSYYQTTPVIYAVSNSATAVKLTMGQTAHSAVTIVRIK